MYIYIIHSLFYNINVLLREISKRLLNVENELGSDEYNLKDGGKD